MRAENNFLLRPEKEIAFGNVRIDAFIQAHAIGAVPERHVNIVGAITAAKRRGGHAQTEIMEKSVFGVQAENLARVSLLDHVAINRIFEKKSKIGEELEIVAAGIRLNAELAVAAAGGFVHEIKILAAGGAAFKIVERAKSTDQAAIQRALWNLPRGIPRRAEAADVKRQFRGFRKMRVKLAEQIEPAKTLRAGNRAVGIIKLPGKIGVVVQAFGGNLIKRGQAIRVKCAALRAEQVAVDMLARAKRHGAGGRQIAEFRKIRAFVHINFLNNIGNHEMQIGIALTVTVRNHIHRHAVH
ncbi:MAG: hypothetical protein ALAOOOJD_02619 [bacterium]|nr:hypothetical protein [bacterium]